MSTIYNSLFELLGFLQKFFVVGSEYVFRNKLFIFIPILLIILFFRIAMANIIHVKRHDKLDWAVFGVILVVHLVSFFIAVPWIWAIVELVLMLFMFLWLVIFDKSRVVKTVIYSNNIIYEDNSEKFDKGNDNEIKEMIKRRDAAILRRFTFSMAHMKLGVPVLVTKYIFKVSPMATEEQLAKAISYLNRFYDDYNWRKQKSANGIKYEFTAELKVNKIMAVPFDKQTSDELDWYVVPFGAIDVSTKQNAKDTPYVWMMQDPKKEGKSYKCLEKTKLFSPAPHAFIVGQTGGGKSVLLNTMIAHWVNKAKQDRQTELYLCDAKRVEFRPYESLEEVAGVAVTLQEAVDLTDNFVEEMLQRNAMMEKEGIKDIPLDGHIKLNRSININGHIIYGSDIIEFKTKDGKLHRDRALNLEGRDDIAEVNIPDNKANGEKEDDNDFGW